MLVPRALPARACIPPSNAGLQARTMGDGRRPRAKRTARPYIIAGGECRPGRTPAARKGRPMTLSADWSYPTAIRFGAGRVTELPEACGAAGIRNPLFVTDRGLLPLPVAQNALDILDAGGLGRAPFAEVDPNPNERNLDAGVAAYRAGGHDGRGGLRRRLGAGPRQDGRLHGRPAPPRVGLRGYRRPVDPGRRGRDRTHRRRPHHGRDGLRSGAGHRAHQFRDPRGRRSSSIPGCCRRR